MPLLPAPPISKQVSRTAFKQKGKAESERPSVDINVTQRSGNQCIESRPRRNRVIHPAFRDRGKRLSLWKRHHSRQASHQDVESIVPNRIGARLADRDVNPTPGPSTEPSQLPLNEVVLESVEFNDHGDTLHVQLHCIEQSKEMSLDASESGFSVVFSTPLLTVVPGRNLTRLHVTENQHAWNVVLRFCDSGIDYEQDINVPRRAGALVMIGDLPLAFF